MKTKINKKEKTITLTVSWREVCYLTNGTKMLIDSGQLQNDIATKESSDMFKQLAELFVKNVDPEELKVQDES